MDSYITNSINRINATEATDVDYVRIGKNSKNLVLCFASNQHNGFERKRSLITAKYTDNNFDIVYFRSYAKNWYLGGVRGIGKNITSTISYLRTICGEYDKVVATGISAGGFASILFGSIIGIDDVVPWIPQTDLEFVYNNLQEPELIRAKRTCPVTWNKYNNVHKVLNEEVNYWYAKPDVREKGRDEVLHGKHQYNNVKSFPSVISLDMDWWVKLLECANS